MAERIGITVEGSVPIPNEYPKLGEIVSVKISAQIISAELLPVRRSVLAMRGSLLVALTYSAADTPHSLSYLKLSLPFVNYATKLPPDTYTAKVIYHLVEPQHSRSLYYSAVLEIERGEGNGA